MGGGGEVAERAATGGGRVVVGAEGGRDGVSKELEVWGEEWTESWGACTDLVVELVNEDSTMKRRPQLTIPTSTSTVAATNRGYENHDES
jgi:hypothetical protein